MRNGKPLSLCLALSLLTACPQASTQEDAGAVDAGRDAGLNDAQPADSGPPDAGRDAGSNDAEPADAAQGDAGLLPNQMWVQVTLDGEPIEGATVVQGGGSKRWTTDTSGRVVVSVDRDIRGEHVLLASHPGARIAGEAAPMQPTLLTIALVRFDASDNPDYPFSDPGEPKRSPTTGQCGHCHQTINEEWFNSPHRSAAKNPTVQDLYAGAAAAYSSMAACSSAGGRWVQGPLPGGGRGPRCYLGVGVQPSLNDSCTEAPCEDPVTERGHCADCHAPGMNGALGGRDLLEAEGHAYEYGVHCDVCHRVASVQVDAPNPGISGRLRLLRPSEPGSPGLGAGGFRPLTFGPSHDSPNPRMGSVQRDHFREATLCAGCHQLDSPVLLPGVSIDSNRWPQGTLPVQSTYEEWRQGALAEAAPCQSCHMPPAPERINGADLQRFPLSDVGYQGGWYRPPGAVRRHAWWGPRQPESRMLQLAAAVSVQHTRSANTLTAEVTVKNVAAGHAIPTGEPMRHIVLRVEAFCGTATLAATSGDVVPGFGGARAVKTRGQDRLHWPDAQVGDRLRVVEQLRGYIDYDGFGPFGDGRFSSAEKGMPIQAYVGQAQITAVGPTGAVSLDGPLPEGALTYLVRGTEDHAGAPGFAFARVLAAPDGQRMVPHFVANDVVSDNRLMPQASFTTTHTFEAPCADPVVQARLLYRSYAPALAEERGWANPSQLMQQVQR